MCSRSDLKTRNIFNTFDMKFNEKKKGWDEVSIELQHNVVHNGREKMHNLARSTYSLQ